MLPNKRWTHALTCLFMVTIVGAMSGCSTLSLATADGQPKAPVSIDAGQYQVRLESNFGKSPTFKGDIDQALTIQDALQRSGALKKYRNMEIDLFRKVEGSYQPLKMAAIYDAGKKRVRPETNYGLRAGDSIRVKSKSENSLGKMMGQFSQVK